MILETVVAAVGLGIGAQLVADRFRLPAILPLLLFGVVAGPAVLGWVDPAQLGDGLEVLVHLGVAIILFEGGLSLKPRQVAAVGGALRNLLTLGVVVTAVGSAYAAHRLAGLPWSIAALFGAIVTVSGPTVVSPLIRHLIAPRRLKTLLMSEGLIVDPIGAVLAYWVLQWIERAGMPLELLITELAKLTLAGGVLGFAGGSLARILIRSRAAAAELRNLAVLSLVMVAYLVAEHQAPQSGILAAVVMGITMSALDLPDLTRIRAFKGQLTTLLISVLFILLSGQLDLEAIRALGWRGVGVVTALVLVVRPLAVFASVWPGQLGWRERVVVALTAPRGIVAAAVASLAALSLRTAGVGGATAVEGLVYLVILITGAWATLMAKVLPRILGYLSDPSRRRAVLVGANRFTELVGRVIHESGRQLVVVDAVPWRLDRFRSLGMVTVPGDARDAASYEEAGVERDSLVIAGTTNDELNLLVAELVHHEFGVEHPVVALQRPPEEFGTRSRAWMELLSGRSVDLPAWGHWLEQGQVSVVEVCPGTEGVPLALRNLRKRWPSQVTRICGWKNGEPEFRVDDERLAEWDRLTLVVADEEPLEFLRSAVPPDEWREISLEDVPRPVAERREERSSEPLESPT